MRKLLQRIGAIVITVLVMMTAFAGTAQAAELGAVRNAFSVGDGITLFLKNPGEDITNVYIGSEEAAYTTPKAGPVRTVILLDNSQSTKESYRNSIEDFIDDLVGEKSDGDLFTIATFSKDINYIVQDDDDYIDIKDKAASIEYNTQATYIGKTLWTVLDDLSRDDNVMYTRIIMITDGMEHESLGYTDTEIQEKFQEVQVPLYTIGFTSQENEAGLKRLFSFSRMSNGMAFNMDEQDLDTIRSAITEDTDIVCVHVKPDDALCDGTVRPVRVAFGESDYTETQIRMPFVAAAPAADTEDTAAAASETPVSEETAAVEETAPAKEPEEPGVLPFLKDHLLVVAAVAAVAVIAIVIVVVMMSQNKAAKKKTKWSAKKTGASKGSGTSSSMSFQSAAGSAGQLSGTETKIMEGGADGGTVILDGGVQAKPIDVTLTDLSDRSKVFHFKVVDHILVGKDPSRVGVVIDYSPYVSRVHCDICHRGDGLVVRDGGGTVIQSANGTFVDDRRATPELPLPNGSILKLGNVRLRVTYQS